MINKRKKTKAEVSQDDAFSRLVDTAPGKEKDNKPKKARSGSKKVLLVLIVLLSLALLALVTGHVSNA